MLKETEFTAFYSYKGGVGRSLALANVAYLLAYKGKKVLIIDLDLEAPGQHATDLFSDAFAESAFRPQGMMDLLEEYKGYRNRLREDGEASDAAHRYRWDLDKYLVRSTVFDAKIVRLEETRPEAEAQLDESGTTKYGSLWLLPATGKSGEELHDYQSQLAGWDWTHFYQEDAGVAFFDALKFQLRRARFDHVLVDSRTGFNDIFYTSTLLIADTVTCLCGLNRQNIEGTAQAVSTLTNHGNIESYGEKRIVLVGSPIPQLRDSEIRARFSDIESEWTIFRKRKFDVIIPYDPYLGLKEEILSMDSDTPLSSANPYVRAVVALTQAIEGKGEFDGVEEFIPTDRINPFPAIRVEYWHESDVVTHFVDPGENIRNALQEFMPTVVFGSRGTGKTMLARWFDYETLAYRLEKEDQVPGSKNIRQIGLWFRLDIDLLNAFNCDEEGPRENFDLLFGQFLDFLFLRKALRALDRLGGLASWLDVSRLCRLLSREMGTDFASDYANLEEQIEERLWEIRAYINNPSTRSMPFIVQGNVLIKTLVEVLRKNVAFRDGMHYFAIFIDEYENFHAYQQRIVNTRLKQARESDRVTLKLLARNDGIHTYKTLARGQPLEATHDFRHYNLDEGIEFSQFCDHIKKIISKHLKGSEYFRRRGYTDPETLFAELTISDEVQELTKGRRSDPLERWIKRNLSDEIGRSLVAWTKNERSPLRRAVATVLINQGKDPERVMEAFRKDSQMSRDWYHNYQMGTIYWLHSLYKKEKTYAGFHHIVGIAGNNTRVALDLCYAIVEHWLARGDDRRLPIDTAVQSAAIHAQSKTYFRKLVEKGQDAGQIHRFVQRLGRLFEMVHKSPRQSEPEINHFKIRGEADSDTEAMLRRCRTDAVLRWLPGNKQKSLADDQRDAWQLHPRYTPHFNISWRRKKGMELTSQDVKALFFGDEDAWKKLVSTKNKEYRSIRGNHKQGHLL